jgi:hypothetical protein
MKNQTANPGVSQTSAGAPEPQALGSGGMTSGAMDTECPMSLSGTTVQTMDTADGTAMTFTTTGDVSDLRRRVRMMADRMTARSAEAAARGGMGGTGEGYGTTMGQPTTQPPSQSMGQPPSQMMGQSTGQTMGQTMGQSTGHAMPAVRTQVEDIDRGARIKMTPDDPSRLADMRQMVQQHVMMMSQTHNCPMMSGSHP